MKSKLPTSGLGAPVDHASTVCAFCINFGLAWQDLQADLPVRIRVRLLANAGHLELVQQRRNERWARSSTMSTGKVDYAQLHERRQYVPDSHPG